MSRVSKNTFDNSIVVHYPAKTVEQTITQAEYELILRFPEQKINMIKFIRSQYGLGLYEAKQVVDTVNSSATIEAF